MHAHVKSSLKEGLQKALDSAREDSGTTGQIDTIAKQFGETSHEFVHSGAINASEAETARIKFEAELKRSAATLPAGDSRVTVA
ncbi:hypothetical protein ACFY3G_43165 [Streptomyces phaeochromogenes]|uniref:hypothetical protein n=1 Tax=Streptomyces phaeochromogenes TaxID=1923 RepID=UPI0036BAC44F